MLTGYVLFRSAGRSLGRSCYRRHGERRQNIRIKKQCVEMIEK